MSKNLLTIKEVVLKNNCPECYSTEGLRLTFKQQVIETKLYKAITSKMSYEIDCKLCNSIIYPVKWTDDIERVFEYQKRAFVPQRASTHIKKATWIGLILAVALGLGAAIVMYYTINI